MADFSKNTRKTWWSKNPVDAVRRINRRWIVHGGLRDTAASYLDALEQTDRPRLLRSCQLALDLAHGLGAHGDPKPWFYGGLFSLAEPAEVEHLLGGHPLTHQVWKNLHGIPGPADIPPGLQALCGGIAEVIRRQPAYANA